MSVAFSIVAAEAVNKFFKKTIPQYLTRETQPISRRHEPTTTNDLRRKT